MRLLYIDSGDLSGFVDGSLYRQILTVYVTEWDITSAQSRRWYNINIRGLALGHVNIKILEFGVCQGFGQHNAIGVINGTNVQSKGKMHSLNFFMKGL